MPGELINARLTSAECEAIAERFVVAMATQDAEAATPRQTLLTLCELYRDARAWTADRPAENTAARRVQASK